MWREQWECIGGWGPSTDNTIQQRSVRICPSLALSLSLSAFLFLYMWHWVTIWGLWWKHAFNATTSSKVNNSRWLYWNELAAISFSRYSRNLHLLVDHILVSVSICLRHRPIKKFQIDFDEIWHVDVMPC